MATLSKKNLKDKLSLLDTFESNLKIMEFKILEQMQKYDRLQKNSLFNIENHLEIVENISKRWVGNFGTFFSHDILNENKDKPSLYILISPQKFDKFSKALISKMEEVIEDNIKPTDFVVTIGEIMRDIAFSHGLTTIAYFPVSLLNNELDFLEKVSSVIRILTVKSLIKKSEIFYPELEIGHNRILRQNILPINLNTWKEDLLKKEKTSDVRNWDDEVKKIMQNSFSDETFWFPSILEINSYLIDLLIKLHLALSRFKNLFKFYEREYQLIISKKEKIEETRDQIKLDLNKIRKEEITNDILILVSAFKSKDQEDDEEMDEQ